MEKWYGKTAIVTGAALGIGAAITKDFLKAGINVIGLDKLADKLEDLKHELKNEKGKMTTIECDVSDRRSVEAAFKQIENLFSVQILVNNAGVVR
jgi:NADP-dependent 3-hydroxy acid dehydrogenase YdfG